MKVVFFARVFYPHIGGVEKHVLEISKLLIKKGHNVTVITEQLSEAHSTHKQSKIVSARSVEKIEGIEIVRINAGKNNWFKKFRIWKELWGKKSIFADADIIHCHDIFFWYLPFKFIYPTKKVFTTFHGYEGNKIPGQGQVFMHNIAEWLSNGNICIGEFYRDWYGTNATYISFGATNATEQKSVNNEQGTKIKDQRTKKRVMYLGRLEEEAGIMEYLKALKILDDQGVKISLDVFGDGSQREEAEKYAKENFRASEQKIKFMGFVENAENKINSYDFIFVSRYLGILEALSNKKPVFAIYNNSIKKDYLEMTPFKNFISISGNANELATQINGIMLRSNNLELRINEGYNWAKKQTWENLTELYLQLWK
jgi:glycosyltransferase involved in cell wall biosynthesis